MIPARQKVFLIGNAGSEIVETNYWETERAAKGLCFVSGNAGVLRLLIPPLSEYFLVEISTGRSVTIEKSIAVRGNIDVVFEDGSPAPFFLSMSRRQFDRALKPGKSPIAVWTRLGKQLELSCSIAKGLS